MNKLISYTVFLIAGLLLGKLLFSNSSSDTPQKLTQIQTAEPTNSLRTSIKKEPENLFLQIYSRLGIERGDIIKEANGIQADSTGRVFPAIVNGYDAGSLCVKFVRANNLRESCYRKSDQGETTENGPSNEGLKTLLENARAKPQTEKGKIGRLILSSGDVVRSVDGQMIDSPEKAMELYNKMKESSIDSIETDQSNIGH